MKIAAFDIGGTALKMGVMARDGRLLETARQSINDSDGDRILQAMLSWLAAHPSCEGIAISAPGYIDPHSGFTPTVKQARKRLLSLLELRRFFLLTANAWRLRSDR